MNPNEEEKSAIDAIEQELYDPKGKVEDLSYHRVRDRKEKELPTSWGEDTPIIKGAESEGGLSFGAKLLIGSSLLLLFVLLFTAWRVLSSSNIISDKNIDLNLSISPYIEGGEPTPLTVTLNNRNKVQLDSATLTLLYKQGTGAQDQEEKIHEKRELGDIMPGDFKKQQFELTVYGAEAEARDVTVKLEYKVKGSNALFSKVATTQVVLKTPPVAVHISGPDVLSVGQSGTFKVEIKNNTGTTTIPSVLLVTLPTNFKVESTNPRTSARGNVWQVDALEPGATHTTSITGTIDGSQGEVSTLRAQVGSVGETVTSIGVVFAAQTFDVLLRSSPLTLAFNFQTEKGSYESIRYGDRVMLGINYKNNSTEPLQNSEFVLKIGGEAALLKQIIAADGYYDSAAGTITWNRASVPALATIAPNSEGSFQVVIPIVTKGTNAPKLTLSLTGKGDSTGPDDVVSSISKTWTVQGSASLGANIAYKNSPLQNTGPIPPQANVDTTYSAHIVVSAQNALTNTKVSFVLPAYVTWRNSSTNPSATTYDAISRTVTWTIGNLGAGKTVSSDIGLSVRPSQSHVGTSPGITSGIVLDADEVESKAHIRTTISALTTHLSGEAWNVNPSLVVDR